VKSALRNREGHQILHGKICRMQQDSNGEALPTSVIQEGKDDGPRDQVDTNDHQQGSRQIVQGHEPQWDMPHCPIIRADTSREYRPCSFRRAKALQAISSHSGPNGSDSKVVPNNNKGGQLSFTGKNTSSAQKEAANTPQGSVIARTYHLI